MGLFSLRYMYYFECNRAKNLKVALLGSGINIIDDILYIVLDFLICSKCKCIVDNDCFCWYSPCYFFEIVIIEDTTDEENEEMGTTFIL